MPTTTSNPFASDVATSLSCYASYREGQLVLESGVEPPASARRVHEALRALVLDDQYPCVGSRSAFNQGNYRFGLYPELDNDESTSALARDLYTFVLEQPQMAGEFSTFIACFERPKSLEPEEFESLLWGQLKKLHELDRAHFDWDPDVSSDPQDPRFSFSFGGRAFFVVGLSPKADRWARSFPWPTLAFNAHFQFEELRESDRFSRLQEAVRDRDAEVEGDINPNLSDFGSHTEARQYAGRPVDEDWRCPVSFPVGPA